jgi:glycosyltransferase involved in cell wall biosynthesis
MNQSPFFSIIVPNYNGGKFINDALFSIINQDFTSWELIVIDGGSTDNSIEIVNKYITKIKYCISEKDRGQSEALNKGFKLAKGKYIFWLNSDDILLPNTLQISYDFIKANPSYKWYVGGTIFFNEYGVIKKCVMATIFNDLFCKYVPISVGGPTSIIDKSVLNFDFVFNESLSYTMDSDLWQRMYLLGYKYKSVSKYLWGFRIHDESKTSHAFKSKPIDKFLNEKQRIINIYGIKNTILGDYFYKIFKLIIGVYFISFLDTNRLKNKNIFKND